MLMIAAAAECREPKRRAEICQSHRYNSKSDMWSAGCVLYEFAAGKHAFQGPNLRALAANIVRGSFPPLPAHCSAPLRELVTGLLDTNPKRRLSVHQALAKPVLKRRIEHFLSQTGLQNEFAHTVIHGRPPRGALVVEAPPLPRPTAPAPPPAAAPQRAGEVELSAAEQAQLARMAGNARGAVDAQAARLDEVRQQQLRAQERAAQARAAEHAQAQARAAAAEAARQRHAAQLRHAEAQRAAAARQAEQVAEQQRRVRVRSELFMPPSDAIVCRVGSKLS